MENSLEKIKNKYGEENYKKLKDIKNEKVIDFIYQYTEMMNPSKIFISTDSEEDKNYIKKRALEENEEHKLKIQNHTIHFDGYNDQGRDKNNTRFLVPPDTDLSEDMNITPVEEGVREINEILKNISKNREVFIQFLTLGPADSVFTIPCVQITDSPYVAHSEFLLYRPGYAQFKKLSLSDEFFRFVHSEGELNENKTTKNIDKRRIYIDIENNIVYSVNTQYGGNSIGLKKLAMRLSIKKASKEGWLTEHMLIMKINGPNNRATYITGAFPSLCGKTSTATLVGENIVGDDIALIRNIDGRARAVNFERGMFGIIMGINSKDDPYIWEVLNNPNEVIFSNILKLQDGSVYWIGKDGPTPEKGFNHSGEWYIGKKDSKDKAIDPSHKNARFTFELKNLKNLDPVLESPDGAPIDGFIYGGRDSDTSVPVEESFDWTHGIITKGASLESETTAATLGKEGVREFNLMAIYDFLSISVKKYINSNIEFGKKLNNPPKIFGVNYFLRDKNGVWLNEKLDKKVWLKWIELKCHNDVVGIKAPTGIFPKYEDLARLFKDCLNKDYSKEEYIKQFTIRIPENLAKIERITKIYTESIKDTPEILFKVLEEQKARLLEAQMKYGDYINPFDLYEI